MNSRFARLAQVVGFIAAAKAAQIIKISFVLGSYTMFFSLSNCVTPLVGAFAGVGGAAGILIFKMFYTALFCAGAISFTHLVQGIPSFFASYYWASNSFVIRVAVPLICMAAFIVHPVGAQAWGYAMYWWLPVIFYAFSLNNLFITALGSTFTAHAVGSVLWLYTNPMTPAVWLALMPIVAIERLLFAAGMVAFYKLVEMLTKRVSVGLFARLYKTA